VETVVARRRYGAALGLGAFASIGGNGVYAGTAAGMLSAAVAGDPERVYVPDSGSGTVEVIDPATFQVVDRFAVGPVPHHVTPRGT
jgi:YVTN family beta-propeller protein